MVPPIRDFEDRGVRWLLDSPTNVQGILTPVAADIASRLDYARMEHIPRSFVPDDLRKREADVIFRSPYRSAVDGVEQTVLVFLLLEHQSTVDPMMGFRLLVYMVALWEWQIRQWRAQKVPESEWRLPPIIPVIFYTGEEPWIGQPGVELLVDLPEDARVLLSKIQESARRAGLAEEFEMTETWAQAVFSEGRQQGIEEGREQGLRRGRMEAAQDALLDLLRAKFGTVSANVTEHVREIADAEELQRLLRSVVAASSMAEMGLQEP